MQHYGKKAPKTTAQARAAHSQPMRATAIAVQPLVEGRAAALRCARVLRVVSVSLEQQALPKCDDQLKSRGR